MTKLGKFSYKTRWIQTAIIIVLFITVYFLQGNTNILYTDSEQDKVGQIFTTTNQVAVVYENKYESLIASYCKKLEEDEFIDQVLCYSNTIDELLHFDELKEKLTSLGQDTDINDNIIKLIYYNYHQKKSTTMTIDEFISFIKSDIYSNEEFNDSITDEAKENLDLLTNFSKPKEINKQRSTDEIASILGMDKSDADDILIYYNSKFLDTKLTIDQFVDFLLDDVANNPKYSSSLDKSTISSLKRLQNFTNLSIIDKKMNREELSNIFRIDENLVEQLLLFSRVNTDSQSKMTLNTFANFTLGMSADDNYKDMFDESTIKSLYLLKTLSDETDITTKFNSTDMNKTLSNLGLNLDQNTIELLYVLYDGYNTDTEMTLNTFASLSLQLANQESFKEFLTDDAIASLNTIVALNAKKDVSMSNHALYRLFSIDDSELVTALDYILNSYDGNLTPYTFVQTLLENDQIKSSLKENEIAKLTKAKFIMDNTHTMYSMINLVASLGQNPMTVSVVYGTYDQKMNKMMDISVKDLINFIYSNKDNSVLSTSIKDKMELLNFAHVVINNTSTQYNYKEISKITSTDKDLVKKIFGLYDYLYKATKLSPLELTDLILKNLNDELLSGKIDKSSLDELTLVNKVMKSTLNKTSYTASDLSKLLGIDKDTLSLPFSLYDSTHTKSNQTISLYNYINFIISDVSNNKKFANKIDAYTIELLTTINSIMKKSLNQEKLNPQDLYSTLEVLSDDLDTKLIELVYIYHGSTNDYDTSWQMTVEEFVNYLNFTILTDKKFDGFLDKNMKKTITNAKKDIDKAKKLIVSDNYSRVILNTKYPLEDEKTFAFLDTLEKDLGHEEGIFIAGTSRMAMEMNHTFNDELNKITLLTIIFIFVVVAITFKNMLIPLILVLIIQCAVYITMSFISVTDGSVYFIALLIVQAILMGATIDYAIVYTSYYKESRLTMDVKESIINAYNKSIHTIISSSSILIIVTLIVARFASAIAAKICETISEGAFASVILILLILPGVLASCDKFICKEK